MAQIKKTQIPNLPLAISLNVILLVVLALALLIDVFKILPVPQIVLIILSIIGLVPVLISAFKALKTGELTIDLLASIALVFSFLARQWYSAVFINLMLASARIFDLWTAMRAKNIIQRLMKFRPTKIRVKEGDKIIEKEVERVKAGDQVVVEAGERIPVDGEVISGQASVNEATLTGESVPVVKKIGNNVLTSTLNESGSLLVKAVRVGKDSTLEKLIALVEEASRKKSKTERIAAKFTQWYIFITLAGAIIIYYFSRDLLLVLSVLLVVCADDIAVAVPLTFTAAIARAAQLGIVIKGSDVLEALPKIRIFMTDKTGTLTYGKPKIKEIRVVQKMDETEFLKLFGMAEIESGHPVGKAIMRYLKEKNIPAISPDEVNEAPGEGVAIVKNRKKYFAGKMEFLEENGIVAGKNELKEIEGIENNGLSVVGLGSDKNLIGFMVIEDEARPFAKVFVKTLKESGIDRVVMLTGDNSRVAARVAKELEMDQFESNLHPEEKLKFIEKTNRETRETIAMVGDGVNDAAALALADVSIAMGAIGSDTAIEAADVALMKDNLKRVPDMIFLAKKTRSIIIQNFAIWGITNATGLVLVSVGILGPVGASTFNFLTDFLPIFNALRVSFFRPKEF